MFILPSMRKAFPLMLVIGLVLLLVPACSSPAPVVPTQVPTNAAAAPAFAATATTELPTATQAPALTPQATETLAPTATAVPPSATPVPPLAATENGFNAWCIPENALVTTEEAAKPWVMPTKARAIAMVEQKSTLYYNARSCVFEMAFNAPVQSGMQLEFYDTIAKATKPWLKMDMSASPDNPNLAYAVVTHTMITQPQVWSANYTIVIRSQDGNEQFKQDIHFMRSWQMARCWNGTMPNPITLTCPKTAWGDIHPNDPGYGWYSKYGPSATPNP